MPAAGSKGAPKNPGEIKDDTSSSREEKQVGYSCQRDGTSIEHRTSWFFLLVHFLFSVIWVMACLITSCHC